MANQRILVVEDDDRIGSALVRALQGAGYEANWARDGVSGLAAAETDLPDLVLLDLGLPDIDGLEVCRELRERTSGLPILMLTALDDELDVVVGLDAGAVDYITKPFKLAELLARIRVHLRDAATGESDQLVVGSVSLDRAARRAWLSEQELDLRPKEFDLLARLLDDVGNVVTRETLMTDVWDEHWFGSTKTLDFHIAALRRKIDPLGAKSPISTLRGVGYRYEKP